ncbi:hypothetical protein FSP39_004453 [Pinctada imbricata]|uniref:Uncharacterized protein n=1 Tax=Pinctada imbricata TaxID=66713 RepID=A0AA88XK83_PINIB|nr:hypothetical protein FSP39_004453 [Pinctada imbricata]
MPILPENVNKLASDGVAYYYMDSDNPTWTLSNVGINEMQGNAVYHTLQQIYDEKDLDSITYAMYNDETPVGTVSITHGHTKGAFAFDASSGFWLIVSVPKFPNIRTGGYQYPKSGLTYGQTMLCVSLNNTELEDVAEIMTYTYPKFYDKHLPNSFAGSNPTLASLFQYRQPHVISAPYKLETTIHSKGDTIFHNFAKATGFNADLYDAWVNERINHNLLVETWQNGPKENFIRSNCTETYKVYNVQEVIFPVGSFDETKDHSKWAVSRTGKWTCIGDINRQV